MTFSRRKLLYGTFFILIIFDNVLSSIIPGFNYFDELILGYSILYLVSHKLTKRLQYGIIIICMICMLVIGLLGNLIWHYNNGYIVVIKDVIAFIKMPITAIAFSRLGEKKKCNEALETAYKLSKIILLIMTVILPVSVVLNNNMIMEYRHGLPSYRFVYSHATFMVYSVLLMLGVLIAHGAKKKDYLFHGCALVLLFFSMRDKAFVAIALYFFIMVIFPNLKRIKIHYVILAAIGAIIVTYDKISMYLSFSWSPRFGLYSAGIKILAMCFPLGSGFGTFASTLSGEYYSKLYYMYGFSSRTAAFVTESNYSDLGDAGLPYYYAQFGIIGFVLFAVILYCIYKIVITKYKLTPSKRRAAFLVMGYMAFALVVENVFVNSTGATAMVFLFLFLGSGSDTCISCSNYN